MELQKIAFLIKSYAFVFTLMSVAIISTTQAKVEVPDAVKPPHLADVRVEGCELKLDWQGLSRILQAQIDPLESKGVENLSDNEFELYAQLSDGLIAVKKLHTLQTTLLITAEKKKQSEQEMTIIAEQAETADTEKTNQKIMELEAVLSGK